MHVFVPLLPFTYIVKLHFCVEYIILINIKEIPVRLVSVQSVPNNRYALHMGFLLQSEIKHEILNETHMFKAIHLKTSL